MSMSFAFLGMRVDLVAIGTVLMDYIPDLMSEDPSAFSEENDVADLDVLTIEKWMELAE